MVSKLAAVLSLVVLFGWVSGANSQTVVNVTADVGQSCVAISDGSFYFAISDPTVLTPATSVVLPAVQCTNGAVATISFESANLPGVQQNCAIGSGGQGFLVETGPGTNQIYYSFECGDGTITGVGIEPANPLLNVSVPIDGSVAPNEADNSPQGNYTDTITLTFAL